MAETNSSGGQTSLKQLFQGMVPGGPELMQGKVISESPLKIQMDGDDKLIINERVAIVPWHLTDYTTKATYRKMDGTLDSWTKNDGSHADPVGGTHVHHGEDFNLYKGVIKVHNALKIGDKVHVLALNGGKVYYILDRVCDPDLSRI